MASAVRTLTCSHLVTNALEILIVCIRLLWRSYSISLWACFTLQAVAYHQEGLILDEKEVKSTNEKAVKPLKTAEKLLKEREVLLKVTSEKNSEGASR